MALMSPNVLILEDSGKWFIGKNPHVVVSQRVGQTKSFGNKVETVCDSVWNGNGWSSARSQALEFATRGDAENYRDLHGKEIG